MKNSKLQARAFAPAALQTFGIAALAFVFALGTGCRSGCPCKCGGAQKADAPKPAVAALAAPAAPAAGKEISLFDGQTLKGWAITDFAGKGDVEVKKGQLILNEGVMTGVNYTNPVPKVNYEIELDACRTTGSDFFCGLTFPVDESYCSFIVGGWGGGTVGISSIDGMDASENETSGYMNFENGQWYHIRVRVTKKKLQAWINDKAMADVLLADKKITVRPGEIELSVPFGLATWATGAAYKNIVLRELPE